MGMRLQGCAEKDAPKAEEEGDLESYLQGILDGNGGDAADEDEEVPSPGGLRSPPQPRKAKAAANAARVRCN